MPIEENKAIVHKMFEAINTHNLDTLDELMASDFIIQMNAKESRGWKMNRHFIEEEFKSFPDLSVNIKDILAEGNKVCVRVTETATHTGEYRGLAPTGNTLSYKVMMIWRVVDDKIIDGWVVYDQLDFLRQLGVLIYKGFTDEN